MGLKIREVHMKNRESWRSKYERRDNFKRPYFSIAFLAVLTTGCLFAEFIMPQDPVYMNLAEINAAPSGAHLFGTDTLGRDIRCFGTGAGFRSQWRSLPRLFLR